MGRIDHQGVADILMLFQTGHRAFKVGDGQVIRVQYIRDKGKGPLGAIFPDDLVIAAFRFPVLNRVADADISDKSQRQAVIGGHGRLLKKEAQQKDACQHQRLEHAFSASFHATIPFYSQPVPEGTPRGLAYYSPNNEKLTEIRSKNARFPIKII